MARKKKAETAPKGPREIDIRVVAEVTDDTPSFYINYAEANIAPHEIAVSFIKIPTKLGADKASQAEQDGVLRIEPSVQVVFAPTLLPGIIRALQTIKDTYEKRSGVPIREPQ